MVEVPQFEDILTKWTQSSDANPSAKPFFFLFVCRVSSQRDGGGRLRMRSVGRRTQKSVQQCRRVHITETDAHTLCRMSHRFPCSSSPHRCVLSRRCVALCATGHRYARVHSQVRPPLKCKPQQLGILSAYDKASWISCLYWTIGSSFL